MSISVKIFLRNYLKKTDPIKKCDSIFNFVDKTMEGQLSNKIIIGLEK
jgi:hypothetical protein